MVFQKSNSPLNRITLPLRFRGLFKKVKKRMSDNNNVFIEADGSIGGVVKSYSRDGEFTPILDSVFYLIRFVVEGEMIVIEN